MYKILIISLCLISSYSFLIKKSMFQYKEVNYPMSLSLSSLDKNTISNAKDVILSDSNGISRSELNEYILQLEKLNPTEDPALSPLLNGVWEVISSGLFSPGMIGIQAIKSIPGPKLLDAEDLTITISSEYPRVTATSAIKVANAKINISITTDIEAESGARLKETYVTGKFLNVQVPLSKFKKISRKVVISYLDSDLLIARDKYGAPEILKRKAFMGNQEVDP